MSCSKVTVHDVPSNRKCQRTLHRLAFGTEACPSRGERLLYRPAYAWCRRCRKKSSAKASTWLRSSKLPYRTIFLLLLSWPNRATPGDVALLAGVSYPTVQKWLARFGERLPEDSEPLQDLVESDESFFGKKKHGNQEAVVGVKQSGGRARLRRVAERDEGTLETLLLEHVHTASKLFTDLWKGYQNVEWYGYAHETCNHSAGRFGPTNQAENLWSCAKRQVRKQHGRFHRPYLDGLLREWEARHNFPELFKTPEAYLKTCLFRFV